MGRVKKIEPVKLFVGVLASSKKLLEHAVSELKGRYGETERESGVWIFQHTQYYEKEMGPQIWRKFVSFQNLIDPIELSQIKLQTNGLEEEMARLFSPPMRPINLDPGYLTLAKVVLATTKDYSHRIYIGDDIFAEVTLSYQKKQWRCAQWTYPDYQTEPYLDFFYQVRKDYHEQIQALNLKNKNS